MRSNIFLLSCVILLGCTDYNNSTLPAGQLSVSHSDQSVSNIPSVTSGSDLTLGLPTQLVNSRAIDRTALFADILVRYDGTIEMVTAQRQGSSDQWRAQISVPFNTAFTLEIVWFDTEDITRVELVTLTREVPPLRGDSTLSYEFVNYDSDAFDIDSDGISNLVEREQGTSPFVANLLETDVDTDLDTIPDVSDNCPDIVNTDQSDSDADGVGDVCDPINNLDLDGDGISNQFDNCSDIANPGQLDTDLDGRGNLCDEDDDGDFSSDEQDCAPINPAIHPNAIEVKDGVDNNCNGNN